MLPSWFRHLLSPHSHSLQALAEFYRVQPNIADAAGGGTAAVSDSGSSGGEEEPRTDAASTPEQRRRQQEWAVQHLVFPALRCLPACLPAALLIGAFTLLQAAKQPSPLLQQSPLNLLHNICAPAVCL
jgi:hypothetical protein